MDTKVDTEPTALDTAKLALALVILLAGIVGYYYYSELPVVVRALGVIVALIVGAWVAMQSAQGQVLWKFIQGSRVELRKVVWPTREETVQTTIAVLVFATVMAVFFWLLDLFLLTFTQWIMSQGS
jgi:preprotein translocase subunit SecE